MQRRILAGAVSLIAALPLALGVVAAPASAAASASAPASAPANASNTEFIQAIEEIQPSLREMYTDKQLVKLGKAFCKALRAGSSVAEVDKISRKYLSDDEALVLVSLSVGAFCDRYWPKVQKYYDLG